MVYFYNMAEKIAAGSDRVIEHDPVLTGKKADLYLHNLVYGDISDEERDCIVDGPEGLIRLHTFLTAGADFSVLRPFRLNLDEESRRTGRERAFRYAIGWCGARNLELNFTLPAVLSTTADMVLVSPNRFIEAGDKPYYWIDISLKEKENEGEKAHKLLVSTRLLPEESDKKLDSRTWHNIEEQLLVDYLEGENNIGFDDLREFRIVVGGQGRGYKYWINLAKNYGFSFFNRRQDLQVGDILQCVPKRDTKNRYWWIDFYKPEQEDLGIKNPIPVVSYRLIPEEHRMDGQNWLGYERQILKDFLVGNPEVTFKDLMPIRMVTPPVFSRITLMSLDGEQLTLNIDKDKPTPGGQVVIVPKEDDDSSYQWLDAHCVTINDGKEEVGEVVASAQIIDRKLVQKGWEGIEEQLLTDYFIGKAPFDCLKPVIIKLGKTPRLYFGKTVKGERRLFCPSSFKPGDELELIPESEEGGLSWFTLKQIKKNVSARYAYDKSSEEFTMHEITFADGSKLDKQTGRFFGKDGKPRVTLMRIKSETGISQISIQRRLRHAQAQRLHYGPPYAYYLEEEINKIVEGFKQGVDILGELNAEKANEYLRNLVEDKE